MPTLVANFLDLRAVILSSLRTFRSSLYRNSIYILGATAGSAFSGFVFWIIAARLTTSASVGITSAALATVVLLKSVGDFGLSIAIIYYAPAEKERSIPLVNTVVAAGWLLSVFSSVVFLIGTPFWAPGLSSLRSDPVLFGAFTTFVAFDSVLALQDALMLSKKRGDYVFWRNMACNLPPIALILITTQFTEGVRALFLAYTLPNLVIGLIVGLRVIPRQYPGYRFLGRLDPQLLRRIVPYGLANHGSNLLWGLPAQVLPIITVSILAPELAGYFLINWTVINFLLIVPRSVTLSMFVEGVHDEAKLWGIARRSLVLILGIILPMVIFLWFVGGYIFYLFGRDYVQVEVLRILLVSTIPFAVNSIYFIILRVQRKMTLLNLFSGTVATIVLVLSTLLGNSLGMNGLALGWLLGHLFPALLVTTIFARSLVYTVPSQTRDTQYAD